MSPTIRKEAGILVLIDMVDFSPQVVAHGGHKTAELAHYFEVELRRRAEPRGYQFIKSIGDAALLFGGVETTEGLVELMLDLLTRNPIPPQHGFQIRLRMVGHQGYFHFILDDQGRRIDVHGSGAIKEFRLEKRAET